MMNDQWDGGNVTKSLLGTSDRLTSETTKENTEPEKGGSCRGASLV